MRTFANPVHISVRSTAEQHSALNPGVNPDPYVLKFNGEYYAYATSGGGVSVLHSSDMVDWTHLGYGYQREGQSDYWAPAVFYDNGLFYLYVSSRKIGEEDVHYEYLQVAVSERPQGPFQFQRQLFDTFSIDAHVVRDVDGGLVLLYSTNATLGIDGERPGTVILADRMLDPLTPEGKPKLIVKPTLDEEIYERNRFGDGRNWHTIEGAFYLQRRGIHYCMYSGNAFTKPHYYIGYSTARHQDGVSIADLTWTKFPDEQTYQPLLRQSAQVEGVGHNSVVKAPNNVDDWVVYHGRDRLDAKDEQGKGADSGEERRQMRIDPLLWLGDNMWVPGPSSEECDAPAFPGFRDLFDGSNGIQPGSSWHNVNGTWHVRNRQLEQQSTVGTARLLLEHSYKAALFEVNLRWQPHHMGGLYGVTARYLSEQHVAEVLLDVGKRTIGIYETVAGVQLDPMTVKVPDRFRFDVYHQLLLAVTGDHISIKLDGMTMLETHLQPLEAADKPRFGLTTHYTAAAFAGVALTGHLALSEQTASRFLPFVNVRQGAWRMEGGALQGRLRDKEAAAIELLHPFDAMDCKLRFDVKGRWGNSPLQLTAIASAGKQLRLDLPAAAGEHTGTVHLQRQGGQLRIWYGRELIASEPWTEDICAVLVEARLDMRLEAVEWTALGF
ncbi:glycoside hydrolase family 43 protein [Paenibacillus campinasensis]|uniref:Family 43 glycosylhydrolase n=1 Tax=Paenibacillus campinasensis TaxID=66347 RepID=A0A268ERK7_9BACL|nr:glycoside hydrolase family 43 protein [Paenibacillus campinasensis]PAD75765.1 hypothetical protein CHH67_14070 [Paenibacillus campinasensis]